VGGYVIEKDDRKCMFCDIVDGNAEAYKICEDELSMCILDIHPYTKGHCLVISKRHVPWWHELNERETESLFKMASMVSNKIMKAFNPDFVFLYARGRRIPHTHLFLIPTHSGDVLDRFFNALEKFQVSPQELARLKEKEFMEEAANRLKAI
jgi:histidine triad (HIT) family protein